MNHPLHLSLLALSVLVPVQGLELRTYNAGLHDRFSSGFPNNPVMNPGFLHNASKFTGVGWWWINGNPAASATQFTLVSPRHVLSVRHLEGAFTNGNWSARFVASDGQVHTRIISPFNSILDGATMVDLAVAQLSSPLPVTVRPVRYRNNLTEGQLKSDTIMVLGKNPVVTGNSVTGGLSSIDDFANAPYAPNYITRMFEFEYAIASGIPDDCHYGPGPGDSSSPVFVEYNNEPALVGLAAQADDDGSKYYGYCTFVPHYITQIDSILNPMGYRMRPAEYTPTTLSLASAAVPGTLRQAHAGDLTFTLGNTGGQTTGNVALTLSFDPAEAPDSVTAPGWIVESMGGGVWSIRKAVMSSGDSIVATATWASLPAVASLDTNVAVESDTTATANPQPSFTLLPSYAAWSAGLTEADEGDDPDSDGLENLLEYALGGDPESGTMLLPGGNPLLPMLSESGGTITLTYPERSDAVVRGLSYIVETSSDLTDLAGSTTLPVGASSSTAAYSPDEPGFVKRTITWPSDGPQRFARVKVALSE
ncbi:hypothetical protein OKA05_05650 [Luteolibacter arcticus]|uniref:CARDB domain-containing protein n=1 Tax=Luteolibacter arcticus TaxID=1581411 RepID=A0ABT3GEJ4_9BACT|nr:hypothetical protein [Luteolibacter arcticus]MCW1922027.1 hypothetical protein [Luteolibacter arcticus]